MDANICTNCDTALDVLVDPADYECAADHTGECHGCGDTLNIDTNFNLHRRCHLIP